ncbi:MAG TPA: hypothetical protein PKC87_06040, partial [Candidatus Absconditabacterales bacterium]|nr:hypothetical protein [Candidatus Absconditabacterales bacterium]
MKSARYFSNLIFFKNQPHRVQSTIPLIIYMAVIFSPKIHKNIAIATSLTSGEVIRKEKVTPRGIHALRNPTNKGIEEQVQKGVIAPNIEAKKYSNQNNLFLLKKFLIFSMGR